MTDRSAPARATLPHARPNPSSSAPHREIFARFVDRLAARISRGRLFGRA